MISNQAKIVKKLLIASNNKKRYDLDYVYRKRKKYDKSLGAINLLSRRSKIEWIDIEGIRIVSVAPLHDTERTIIYLHGGGFVFGMSAIHVAYAERLAKSCNAKVLLINYSLSPEAKFPVALNEIQLVWKRLIKDGLDPTKTVIMGDSAGASLAISSAIKFKNDNLPQPSCMVLFSPSVDSTFSGKSYTTNSDKDIILSIYIMDFFISSYVEDNYKTDPLVSPLFANLRGLPPFLLQVGSDEILLSECKAFVKHAKKSKVKTALYIGKGMWHNWHLSANYVPESSRSIKTVTDYIISNC
ncbi:MAG: hypothetical protein PWQ10_40 [Patescibacteria group bacterium]|nr:hypothetical protein [Patescibacteria group bacterium]